MKHIRIVSPSGAIDRQYIEGATERLLLWGYTVSVGTHAYDRCGRFAATDDERLQDLHEALADPAVDIILCARGGYGLQRIIDRVGSVRKPIVGFSDITALHQAAALAGQPSLHAIMCKHLATLDEAGDVCRTTRAAIGGKALDYTLPSHPLNQVGEAHGCIRGGNLSVLYGLQGTPYSLEYTLHEGDILFLEDIAERHYHVDRMMNNLRLSGVLSRVGGVIVGRWADCDDDPSMGCTLQQTIRHALRGLNVPMLFDFPAGHVPDNMPLWLNTPAHLCVDESGARVRIN